MVVVVAGTTGRQERMVVMAGEEWEEKMLRALEELASREPQSISKIIKCQGRQVERERFEKRRRRSREREEGGGGTCVRMLVYVLVEQRRENIKAAGSREKRRI